MSQEFRAVIKAGGYHPVYETGNYIHYRSGLKPLVFRTKNSDEIRLEVGESYRYPFQFDEVSIINSEREQVVDVFIGSGQLNGNIAGNFNVAIRQGEGIKSRRLDIPASSKITIDEDVARLELRLQNCSTESPILIGDFDVATNGFEIEPSGKFVIDRAAPSKVSIYNPSGDSITVKVFEQIDTYLARFIPPNALTLRDGEPLETNKYRILER